MAKVIATKIEELEAKGEPEGVRARNGEWRNWNECGDKQGWSKTFLIYTKGYGKNML